MSDTNTRKPLDVRNNSAVLFFDENNNLRGEGKIEEETFEITGTHKKTRADRSLWEIEGKGLFGEVLGGTVFEDEEKMSAGGKPMPTVTGTLKTTNGKADYRFAGWKKEARERKGLMYLSILFELKQKA